MNARLPIHACSVWLAVVSMLTALSCKENVPTRQSLNDAVRQTEIAPDLEVEVHGGSILAVTPASTDSSAARVVIRSQSLDLRVDLKNHLCRKTWVHMTTTHLAQDRLETNAKAFLDQRPSNGFATTGEDPDGTTFADDIHDPKWTALSEVDAFDVESTNTLPGTIQWTTCMARSTRFLRLVPGHVDEAGCGFPTTDEEDGACAEASDNQNQDLAQGAFVIRHRLSTPITGTYQFAVWGNNQSAQAIRGRLVTAVNASEALFVMITGDLTANGSTPALRNATEFLDSRLQIPWFATLGDRDVQGRAALEYSTLIGASTFAFDAGDVRVVTIDSGDRAMGISTRESVADWLAGKTLGWATPAPPAALVLTHVPPFDVYGTRGNGLKQRFEGASLVALLSRARVPYLFTSQLSQFKIEKAGDTQVVHAGGGGARLPDGDDDGHYWLLITVDPSCNQGAEIVCAGERSSDVCPCINIEKKNLNASP